jgi:hypothetical protein
MKRKLKAAGITAGLFAIILALGFGASKYPVKLFEVIEKFKEGLAVLRQAEVYAQRIDWLVSGDDGEASFLQRLKEDLGKL